MATWRSIAKMVFSLERWIPGNYGYSDYQDVTYTWEYNTTADSLRITIKDGQGEKDEYYGNAEAEAKLKVLANWYATYEGRERLIYLLKEELVSEQDKEGL